MSTPTPPPAERCGIEFYGLLCSREPGHTDQHIHRTDLPQPTSTAAARSPLVLRRHPVTDQRPASAGPVGDLPERVVEAAVKAAYGSMTHDPQPWSDDSLERAIPKALAAALPLIRAHIADDLRAYADRSEGDRSWDNGSLAAQRRHGGIAGVREVAARIARGGTDD